MYSYSYSYTNVRYIGDTGLNNVHTANSEARPNVMQSQISEMRQHA
jgi:hypothetical protein